MPFQEDFLIEQFMDRHEKDVKYNMGETCCHSLNLNELSELTGEKFELDQNVRLTYGSIWGTQSLRDLVAKIHSNGEVQLTAENVLITNGAIGANFLVHYTLAGPGDHIICVDPTYQQLSSVPNMFGADVELLHLDAEDGYTPSIEKLRRKVKNNTKYIVLNNPNNPLGSVISTEKLTEIIELAEENKILIVCDEVYSPLFHSSKQPKSLCQLSAQGIVTGSMSKAYSAAGLRLGWIVSQDKELLRQAASRRDFNTISVSIIDDHVSQYILKHRDVVLKRNFDLCRKNLTIMKDFIRSSNGKFSFVHEPEGGSVCLLRVEGVENTNSFATKLATEFKVLCAPGECFGVPGTLRIGYGNPTEDLIEGLKLLELAYDIMFPA
ncbi:LAQU0S37e00166g1_1 [Lachancea quebecensis]|uniref:LAQU0S37e00166g1_1 n=1 Tax=Lachancea quebecensis TaxID=1654605 RepID=A0A0P1L095_9SACH|nr:LAQU0S37e00166g1_1 [Lachancea quebecensis]